MSKIQLYTFLIFIAITAVVLYVFFIVPQPNYESKISLLLIPKAEFIASDMSSITNNVVFITQNILNDGNLINDTAKVKVVQLQGTSIIQFIIQADSINNVNKIENIAIKNSLIKISKYYNINSDLSIKIIKKEPVHKTAFSSFASYFVIFFAIVGLIAGLFALFYIIDLLQMKNRYDESIDGKKIFANYNSDHALYNDNHIENENIIIDDEYDSNFKNKENIVKVDNNTNNKVKIADEIIDSESNAINSDKSVVEKSPVEMISKVPEGLPTTPNNLPVVDVSDFGLGGKDENINEINTKESEEIAEPTEEELKARLNELLGGKL